MQADFEEHMAPQGSSSPDASSFRITKGFMLHFMVQLSLVDDAEPSLREVDMGRIHHRILCFADFVPGISVTKLLGLMRVKHQNIQSALRRLVDEDYIIFRPSPIDGRVKLLHCTAKGNALLARVSAVQYGRIARAYAEVSPRDVQGYLKVMTAMLDADRRDWVAPTNADGAQT